jgi:phage baseplate assembly protein W
MADALFTDFASTATGDLATNAQGDVETVSGTDNLSAALQRRFETPIGALFYDTTYGNAVFDRLSQPMGQNFETDLASDATACILADSRVQSVNVTVTIDRESRTVQLNISYVAKDGTTGSFERGIALRV